MWFRNELSSLAEVSLYYSFSNLFQSVEADNWIGAWALWYTDKISFRHQLINSLYTVKYSPSDFLLLKHFSTHTRFFLSLRPAFYSPTSNINAVAANCLLENEWECIFDGDNRRPPITCNGKWLNTTNRVNTGHSFGTKMERWRNGNLTSSVNRP